MVNRYCSKTDVEDYLDIVLNATDYPKLSLVEDWITASENDIDNYTNSSFDRDDITETLSPQVATKTLFLKKTPINSITSITLRKGGSDISPEYDIPLVLNTDYSIESPKLGLILLSKYIAGNKAIKIDYNGGSDIIDLSIKELCLAMVKKRYLESVLGISSLDTELVSISSIRVSEKSSGNIKLSIEQLDKEIKDKLSKLSGSNRTSIVGFSIL